MKRPRSISSVGFYFSPAIFLAVLLFLAPPLRAQHPSFTADIGGGFSNPVYSTGSHLNTGWNISAGAGINATSHLGIQGDFLYSGFDINRRTLNELDFPGGDMQFWGLTLDPVVHLNRTGRTDAYIIGGGGIYHRTIEFTTPTIQTATVFDPFFGVFYPVGIAANQVIQSVSTLKGGVNIGAGLSLKLGGGNTRFFVEARYHHMYTEPNATTVIPVTFGIRWD